MEDRPNPSRLNNFGVEVSGGLPYGERHRPPVSLERRRAVIAALLAAGLAWWLLIRALFNLPKYGITGLTMHAEPFYLDSDFWYEGVSAAILLGTPGLAVAATLLAGTRWPLALLRGLLVAAIHALVVLVCVCLLWVWGSGGFWTVVWVLATLLGSWLWVALIPIHRRSRAALERSGSATAPTE